MTFSTRNHKKTCKGKNYQKLLAKYKEKQNPPPPPFFLKKKKTNKQKQNKQKKTCKMTQVTMMSG
jgi:hypothetical protein